MGNGVTRADIEEGKRRDEMLARQGKLLGTGQTATQMVFQGELNPERFGRYEDWKKYKDGGHSIIYLTQDSETGRTVAVKKHLHYMPESADDVAAIRDAQKRYEREITILGKMRHPGIVQAQGYFYRTEHGIPYPYLVMEPLLTDTIEDRLERGEVSNEQEAREALLSIGALLDFLHTGNGRLITYRDLKPGNIKIMKREAPWPHKLVDFSESRIGNQTQTGSVMGTVGYNAPESYGLRIADRTTDFYSLLRIASHMMIGDRDLFMKTHLNWSKTLREIKDEGNLNISEQLLKAIERGTARSPEGRYKTIVELARDIGYNIERAPQNREELEAILGHRGLPAPVKARTPTQPKTEAAETEELDRRLDSMKRFPNFPPVRIEENENFVYIDGVPLSKRDNVYETAKVIFDSIAGKLNLTQEFRGKISERVLGYLQLAAQQHPILQEPVTGRRTLESLAREKKPRRRDFIKFGIEPKSLDNPTPVLSFNYRKAEYQEAKQNHLAQRKELCDVLGVDEDNFDFINRGASIGLIGGVASSVAVVPILKYLGFVPMPIEYAVIVGVLDFFGNLALGAIAGSKLGKYVAKRKLIKRAREMDSLIYQGRVAQGLEPAETQGAKETDRRKIYFNPAKTERVSQELSGYEDIHEEEGRGGIVGGIKKK